MSYEEDGRQPYTSLCACGKGFLRYYLVMESNDWGQTREHKTNVEILCEYCREHYHYELTDSSDGVLVPNDLLLPPPIPELHNNECYSEDERFIGEYEKPVIEKIIADMTTPKHRYIKDLNYSPAVKYAEDWVNRYRKRSLEPMVKNLRRILDHYSSIEASRKKKQPKIDEYEKRKEEREKEVRRVEQKSFFPDFKYDAKQEEIDREQAKKAQEEYKGLHRYDSFNAEVTYHQSYKVDSTGNYWDSFHILRCTDPQYLILNKPEFGTASITIVKKYRCKCTMCGKEIEVKSSEFEILFDDEVGYYPAVQCDCHKVSSFEAKTMDILNNHGVSYIREYSFDELVGDRGHPLRFDFAVLNPKSCDNSEKKRICFLLELQGPHHYKQGRYDEYGDFNEDKGSDYSDARARIAKQKHYDDLKVQYCKKNGIALEFIKYTESSYSELEKQITDILESYGIDGESGFIPF